jgi:hypothetical protein
LQGGDNQEGVFVPYNLQPNGFIEWKNKSIIGTTKAMLFLLVEACNTTIYIQHCPYRILEDKTPEKEFTGVKPKVSNFYIFGCLFYIHVPVERRSILDPSNKNDLFVGYNKTLKAYYFRLNPPKRSVFD